MPVQQQKKINTIGNVGNAYSVNAGDFKSAAIFTVADDGTIEKNEVGIFLLNPSTWSESKSSNWVPQQIPGQSDPVLQWVSSGARTISFQALVTAETSDFISGLKKQPGKSSSNSDLLSQASAIFGGIAAAFAKTVDVPKLSREDDDVDLDISLYLNYYRSLLYPVYDDVESPRKLVQSPPLVVIYNGKSFVKFPYEEKITTQHDLWVVTNLEIQITKQLPNLAPMEAVVNFQLTQYNIRSFDRNRFLRDDD